MYQVDNAIIMAAGTSSRFAPLSSECPKGLITVRGEVLIERQIRQLQEVGIRDITVVTGYRQEQFQYLADQFGVSLVHNPDYLTRNNNASLYVVRDRLKNTYICSSDNYFCQNVFESQVDSPYYAAVYADGPTAEWCMEEDQDGYVSAVTTGGQDAWYMLGHVFWSEDFSRRFVKILEDCYDLPETADLLWESIYKAHLDELKLRIRKYPADVIFEFDTLDELREFDESYRTDTRSQILKSVASQLGCTEADITHVEAYKDKNNAASGFTFLAGGIAYRYAYDKKEFWRI